MNHHPDNDLPPAAPGAGLAAALRLAADDLRTRHPPPELKARVLSAAQAAATAAAAGRPSAAASSGPRLGVPGRVGAASTAGGSGRLATPPAHGGRWAWSGAAVCAAVLLGSALMMLRMPPLSSVDDGVRIGGLGSGFLPLVPPERWPREAAAAWLVSTELPGERLAALGLPYDPGRAGDSVRAELLLHPSGEVLAVRFLH